MRTVILDPVRIERTLKRIAYQILENCYQEKEVTLIGIEPRGIWMAERVDGFINEISDMKTSLHNLHVEALEKLDELSPLIKKRNVILFDDVVKSGRTMMKVASAVMDHGPHLMFTACLVDRKHRRFPIQSDFTGLSLATTIQEHIQLEIEPKPTIYLE